MKVRAIPIAFVAAAQSSGRGLATIPVLLVLLSTAAAQQYPAPAYPAPGQPPAYSYPAQPPAYSGPGYGGPSSAPPALQQEAVPPPPPGSAMAWTPGYWSWAGRWVWVPGRYVARPYPRAAWVPGHWRPRGPGWVWIPGHWRR